MSSATQEHGTEVPPGDLFRRLRETAGAAWRAYVEHPFVRGLADGSLPIACFKRYLIQDYLFLLQFARAHALAAYKGETLEDMRRGSGGLSAIVDGEMGLHVRYCAEWGVDEATMIATPEATETVAYTRFVLDKGMAGDLLDLHVALLPCMAGYAEIGARLANDPATKREGNPYSSWIEAYSGSEYLEAAAAETRYLDDLGRRRGGEGRFADLVRTFAAASRLEAEFWSMGLRAR